MDNDGVFDADADDDVPAEHTEPNETNADVASTTQEDNDEEIHEDNEEQVEEVLEDDEE